MIPKISIADLKESLLACAKRFPVTLLFAIAFNMASIYMILDESFKGVIIYYLGTGFLLSLMLELWGEETADRRRYMIVSALSHLILAIDAIYLYNLDTTNYDTALYISRASVLVSLPLGIFYLSFLRQTNDIQSWNFTRKIIFRAFLCVLVGIVMAAGFSGLLFCVDSLFNAGFSYKVYSISCVLWGSLLSILLFLSRIPQGEMKHDEEILHSGFLLGITRYLFVPLVSCYMLVLYGYLFKIIVTWTLPKGVVCSCVNTMMLGMIIIQFLLYPTLRSGEAKRYERLVVRWMPVIALPLLLLMTVGIIRRLNDYGITTDRLYVLTLNVWFYIVCIGLWMTRNRRIHWISLSFSALLLLTSVHPFNYTELTRMKMMHDLTEMISAYPPSHLPMSNSEFIRWIDTLPEDRQARTYSQFQYLDQWSNRRKDLDGWIEKDVYLYHNFENLNDLLSIQNEDELFFPWNADTLVCYKSPIKETPIPNGASSMVQKIGDIKFKVCPADSLLSLHIVYQTSAGTDSADFVCSIPELRTMQQDAIAPVPFRNVTGDAYPAFVPTSVCINEYRGALNVHYNAYIFMK